MLACFDTSALVPLLVREPGTPAARRVWDEAERVVAATIVHVEVRAALAAADRAGRLGDVHGLLVRRWDQLRAQLDLVEVDGTLVDDAAGLATAQGLRGYDAVHLAAALRVADDTTVLVAGDTRLLRAAGRAGLATAAVG